MASRRDDVCAEPQFHNSVSDWWNLLTPGEEVQPDRERRNTSTLVMCATSQESYSLHDSQIKSPVRLIPC